MPTGDLTTAAEIRRLFLDFFKEHDHTIVPSSSLVPASDPTLLFTNAGMVQFKEYFLNPDAAPYKRAASVQRCLRVGGKHNDLENVGYTTRHHTFFEMLGNFSFGGYFKKEAIHLAWEFLTKALKLPEEKLHVTVFKQDDEATEIWLQEVGIPKNRFSRLGKAENYWSMGETGPCGPCSEIHFDQGKNVGCKKKNCGVQCDCDRFLEVWNLVFMQFNRDEAGNEKPLPHPCIDTGMGLERVTAVVQGVTNNYHTDLFQSIIAKLATLFKQSYKNGKGELDPSFHVVSDHLRATVFMVADGMVPSNEGRGYVLRRILRRAMRHSRMLGATQPLLYSMVKTIVADMQKAYPELGDKTQTIEECVREEEEQFLETLDRGIKHLDEKLQPLKKSGRKSFPGDVAFHLYETYGFPVDLTEDILRGEGLRLEHKSFDQAFAAHRQKAKGSWKGGVADTHLQAEIESNLRSSGRPTGTGFIGYDQTSCEEAKLVGIYNQAGKPLQKLTTSGEYLLVFDQTPFYAESGGQVGDQGWVRNKNCRGEVKDTFKVLGVHVHRIHLQEGSAALKDSFQLAINEARRGLIARNHTLTHILHATLRETLGEHVRQAGSYLDDKRLTFDFIQPTALTRQQLEAIEKTINERIAANSAVKTENNVDYKKAIERGATAFFAEKYGDRVRVVSIDDYSMELCGGTHVSLTGEIGFSHVRGDRSVAAKTRRIEAVSGPFAIDVVQQELACLNLIAEELGTPTATLDARLHSLLEENKKLKKQLRENANREFDGLLEQMLQQATKHENFKIVSRTLPEASAETLRDYSDRVMDKMKRGIVALGTKTNGRAVVIVKVSKDLTDRYSAAKVVKAISPIIGGGGGGRAEMAQAGGSKPDKLDEALAQIHTFI